MKCVMFGSIGDVVWFSGMEIYFQLKGTQQPLGNSLVCAEIARRSELKI